MELSPRISREYSPGSSKTDLLNDYHRLAADTLLGTGSRTDSAVLEAAEDGQLNRLKSLLASSPSSINARCPSSGDTPIIVAAREGHMDVVRYLLKRGADITVQNDVDETAFDVCSGRMQKMILDNIQHEDRAMSNAQALLHSAWLGDAVSVKKSLESGKNYLDVNCRNSDGNSPLLLVTRDISLFEQVQNAMQSDYDPVSVMQDLIANHADVNTCDKKGRSALHLVASSQGVHARKMVSLLLSNGSSVDAQNEETLSPLHVASNKGHQAIIVALVEEGGADVNLRGGERGDTPLMLSARGGHNEAARYLISKGADLTAVDENGDTALTVAKSPSMVRLLKEAWVEQAESSHSRSPSPTPTSPSHKHAAKQSPLDPPPNAQSKLLSPADGPSILLTKPSVTSLTLDEVSGAGLVVTPTTPQLSDEEKFFLTEGKIRRSSEEGKFAAVGGAGEHQVRRRSEGEMEVGVVRRGSKDREEVDFPVPTRQGSLNRHTPTPSANEAEADDELEAGHGSRRVKPANRRAKIRGILSKRNADREAREVQGGPRALPTGLDRAGSLTRLTTTSEEEITTYSSADEASRHQPIRAAKLVRGRSRDDGKGVVWRKKVAGGGGGGSRPSNLSLQQGTADPTLSRSYDCLVNPNSPLASPKQDKKVSPLLPSVGKSPMSPLSKTSLQYKPSSGTTQLSEHLPSLANMQAVAVVAVDTDREKLSMLNFKGKGGGRGGRRNQDRLAVGGGVAVGGGMQDSSGFTRSKSLMNIKREGKMVAHHEALLPPQFNHKKRNSTGSVAFTRAESKVPLLPNVVTSQFGFGIQGGGMGGAPKQEGGAWSHTSKGRGRYTKNTIPSPTSPLATKVPMGNKLSVLDELRESSEKSLSNSSQQSMGSSTLKSSDFEIDSLEQSQEVVLLSTSPRHLQTKGEGSQSNSGEREGREAAGGGGGGGLNLPLPPQNPNLMVNYANRHGNTPLSPIWNQIGYFQSDTDASTNSEFITSYIGDMTPLPTVLSPDFNNKPLPPPSAGGSCSDSNLDSGREPSSGESGGEGEGQGQGKDGCLKWKRGRLLGKGAYGKVWEGLLSSARMIAVKEVELDTDSLERAQSQYEKIQAEVGILRSLKHRNIVSYLGTSMHMATVYIFMQYISGGSLQSILKRFGPLDSLTVKHYTKQITNALCYLHDNGIIHRDIKGANIMVNSRGVVKLIDFGCAKNCQDMASNMHSVRGTPYWMAPEVICGNGYGRKSDIWSLGCTVLEMATAKAPWSEFPPESAMFQIGMGKPIPPLPDHLPKILTEFFFLCLTREQSERPSANDLLQHKFLST